MQLPAQLYHLVFDETLLKRTFPPLTIIPELNNTWAIPKGLKSTLTHQRKNFKPNPFVRVANFRLTTRWHYTKVVHEVEAF